MTAIVSAFPGHCSPMMRIVVGVLAMWTLSATPTMADEADACISCHGAKGVSDKPRMPNIAGLNKPYLTTTLTNYLSGARGTVVKEHKENLTPEAITALATKFSQLPWEYAKGNVIDPAKAEAGEKPTTRCRLCHEDNGRSQEDDMPRMAGQNLEYTIDRLRAIREDPKSTMPGKMMGMFKEMSDSDVEAMAHFFSGQK